MGIVQADTIGTTKQAPSKSTSNSTLSTETGRLKQEASNFPGFAEYDRNRSRKLQNPERVQFWRFVAGFSSHYYKSTGVCQSQFPLLAADFLITYILVSPTAQKLRKQ